MTEHITKDSDKRAEDAAVARFSMLRSEVIDLFADAETQITKYACIHAVKPPVATLPMGHKITEALKVKAGPQRSKAIKAEADAHLKVIQALLPDRAAIVHSRMSIARCVSESFVAIFKNAKDVADSSNNALVYDEAELTAFLDKLKQTNVKLVSALWAKNGPQQPVK
jgi:hypothetical protein